MRNQLLGLKNSQYIYIKFITDRYITKPNKYKVYTYLTYLLTNLLSY